MKNSTKTSLRSLAGFIAALTLFSGCDSLDSSGDAAQIATMKTFHMEPVRGAVVNFKNRDPQDVIILTQEMIARELEKKGYVEVSMSDPADFRVSPGWTFYTDNSVNTGIRQTPDNFFDQSVSDTMGVGYARMNIDFLTNTDGQLWSTSASWGIRTDISTTSDFMSAAEIALSALPESTVTPQPTGSVPPMPQTGVQAAPMPMTPSPFPGTPSPANPAPGTPQN